MKEHIAERSGDLKTAQNKKSYSVAEIQQILGISRPTAYALIKKNLFQSVRMGNGIRIVKSSFDAWLSDGELGETQRANYFSRLYLIDCAVPSVNIYSCRKCGTLQTAGLSA